LHWQIKVTFNTKALKLFKTGFIIGRLNHYCSVGEMPTDPLSTGLLKDNDDEEWAEKAEEADKQLCPLVLFIVIHHAKAPGGRGDRLQATICGYHPEDGRTGA